MKNKKNQEKKFSAGIFFLIFFLLILISGCKGKKDVKKSLEDIRTGTQGIVFSFLQNAPPDTIHTQDGSDNTFDVILELKNKGAYPQPGEAGEGKNAPHGLIILSGYDNRIIQFGDGDAAASQYFSDKALEGKSIINTNGGLDILIFKGKVSVDNLCTEKYAPTLLATACYPYKTVAGPSVCIDPNPYSTFSQKKVCQVSGVSLSNQGAPIAVTKIDEEAFDGRTQFKITIKNVGGGDVFMGLGGVFIDKCLVLQRNDIDKVYIEGITLGNSPLKCRPFLDTADGNSGTIRLINGEGFILCDFSGYDKSSTAYTTPLTIKLSYQYRNTAEKKIQIRREMTSDARSTCGTTSAFEGYNPYQ